MSKSSQESSPITQWREKVDEAFDRMFGLPAFPPKGMDVDGLRELQTDVRKAYITSATIELMTQIIGEDDDPMDLKNFNDYAEHRNALRAELRQSLKELKQ